MKWPDEAEVRAGLIRWAQGVRTRHPAVDRIGYIGSYARGDWGPGSDLDIVVVLTCDDPSSRTAIERESTQEIPVPADLLVFGQKEFNQLLASASRFGEVLSRECRWIGCCGKVKAWSPPPAP